MISGSILWFNVALYLLAFLAALGALNKMKVGSTRPCVIAAMVLLALGLASQALGEIWRAWQPIADTATAGGVLALLIASQRVHTWFLERWANPIASVIAFGGLALFVGSLLSGCALAPEPKAIVTAKAGLIPECEELEVHIVDSPGGRYYVFDGDGFLALAERFRQLQAGACRLPAFQ